jgi:hypothetical protein
MERCGRFYTQDRVDLVHSLKTSFQAESRTVGNVMRPFINIFELSASFALTQLCVNADSSQAQPCSQSYSLFDSEEDFEKDTDVVAKRHKRLIYSLFFVSDECLKLCERSPRHTIVIQLRVFWEISE